MSTTLPCTRRPPDARLRGNLAHRPVRAALDARPCPCPLRAFPPTSLPAAGRRGGRRTAPPWCAALRTRDRRRGRVASARGLHAPRALRAGAGLLRRRRAQVRRRRRLRHRARADAAVRRARSRCRSRRSSRRRGGEIVELGAGTGALAADLLRGARRASARFPRATRSSRSRRTCASGSGPRSPRRVPALAATRRVARRGAGTHRRRRRDERGARRDSAARASCAAAGAGTSAACAARGSGPRARRPRCSRPGTLLRLGAGALSRRHRLRERGQPGRGGAGRGPRRRARRRRAARASTTASRAASTTTRKRATGTLMAHYRHRAHDRSAAVAGAVRPHGARRLHRDRRGRGARGAGGRGLHVAGGLPAGLRHPRPACGGGRAGRAVDYVREAAAVQRLLSPAEMGELFKVLALAHRRAIAWPGFALADMRHRL